MEYANKESLNFQILDKEETDEGGSGSDHTTHPDGENENSTYNNYYNTIK